MPPHAGSPFEMGFRRRRMIRLDHYEDPGIDPAVHDELRGFVAKRKEEIERAAG